MADQEAKVNFPRFLVCRAAGVSGDHVIVRSSGGSLTTPSTVGAHSPAVKSVPRDRSAALDAVRVAAVVAVVVGHSRSENAARILTFSWHVPVFFILSGYLLRSRRDAADELARRTKTVLVPTLCWGMIVTVGWLIHTHHAGAPVGVPFVKRLLWGGVALGYPYSPFWFMPVLVFAVVLVRLLDATHRWAALGVGTVGYLYCLAFPEAVAASLWSIALVPACLLFVLAGRQLRTWRSRIPYPFALGILLLAVAAAALRLGLEPVNIKAGSFGTPIFSALNAVLISSGMILTTEATFSHVPRESAMSRGINLLAATSLPVILGHMLMLSSWTKPWTWPEIVATVVGLWILGLVLHRSRIASRYLL